MKEEIIISSKEKLNKEENKKEIKVITSDTFQKEFSNVMDDLKKIDFANLKKKHFVIVPDNCSYTFEKGILENVSNTTFNIGVYTFSRLLNTVLTSKIEKKFVSPKTGVMIMTKIMLENKANLKCFGVSMYGLGAEESVYNLILQLKSCGITPDMLNSFDLGSNANLNVKIHDIALLYSEYEAFLAEGYYDSVNKLGILNETLAKSEILKNANLYIAGFTSLSKMESLVISRCIKQAKETKVYMTYDENNHVYLGEILKIIQDIASSLNYKLNIEKKNDLLNIVKKTIKSEVFSYKKTTKKIEVEDEVDIYEAQDMLDECSYVMNKITYLVKEKGYRYKDIAIVTQNFEDYNIPLSLAFNTFDIPYFHDDGKKLSGHILARFLISLLKIKNGKYIKKDVIAFVKNELFELENSKKCDFENYAIKYLPERYDFKKSFKYGKNNNESLYEVAEEVRVKLCDLIDSLKIISPSTTASLCNSITNFLEDNNYKGKVEEYENNMEKSTDSFIKQYSSQVYPMIENVLAWLGNIFKNTYLTLEQFINILASGFATQDISIVPTNIDNVFLSNMFDAKLIGKKVLFVLNVNDGDLPKPMKDNNVLTDKDIDYLKSKNIDVNPNIKLANRRSLEEILFVLLGFEDSVTLSYLAMDSKRGEKKPSQIIKTFENAFKKKDGSPIIKNNVSVVSYLNEKDVNVEKLACFLANERNAKKQLIKNLRMCKDGYSISKETYSLIYEALKELEDMDNIEKLIEEIKEPNKTIILKNGNELFFYGDTTSISEMQTYYECPFRHFISYGLRANERETSEMQSRDIGTYMHEIVENYAKEVENIPYTKQDSDNKVEEIIDSIIQKEEYSFYKESAKQRCIIEALKKEAKRVCFNILGFYKNSNFKFDEAEKSFNTSNNVTFNVNDRNIVYKGKIDRIDRLNDNVILIDYKTGTTNYTLTDLYLGKKIQLYAYMLAVNDDKNKPCGVFFLPISDKLKSNKKEANNVNRMVGMFLDEEDIVTALDTSLDEQSKESKYVPIKVNNKKGVISKTNTSGSLCASRGEFDKIEGYVKEISKNGIREMLEGCISISPYEKSCTYCAFKRTCKYNDQDFDSERKLGTTISKEKIIGVVKK